MAAVPHPSLLVYLGLGALVAWRMYSRIRRVIGRQHLSNNRPKVTIVVFTLLFGLLLFTTFAQPINAVALAGGAIVGIALSALFIGRMAWRFFQLYSLDGQTPSPAGMNNITSSPLTLVIFATLAGYYVTYAIGLLRWRRRVTTSGS